MEDLQAIKSFTVTIYVPTVEIDEDGARTYMVQSDIDKIGESISKEMRELNFTEMVKAMVQGLVEEHFLSAKPVAIVSDE